MVTKREFVISVKSLMGRPGTMSEFNYPVVLGERWGTEIVRIPKGEEIDLDFRLESVHEGILASGEADGDADTECSRCLKEFNHEFNVAFQELFAYSGELEDDLKVIGEAVDIEEVVRDAVISSFPFQPVCEAKCLGLCVDCGANLNEDPSHAHEEQIDSRWAALEKLRKKEE